MQFSEYVGIPYRSNGRERDGLDCWGLVRLFYMEQLGVTLPSYEGKYVSAEEHHEIARLISGEVGAWEQTEAPRDGDVVLLSVLREPAHVGIFISPNRLLHARRGTDSVIERLGSTAFSRRVEGFFRCRG